MITRRTTEDTIVVSIYDPAVMRINPSRLRKYVITRNLEDAGIDKSGRIEETGEMATIFKVRHLQQKMVQIIDGAKESSIHQRMIFKSCVHDILNCEGIRISRDEDDKSISDETIGELGMDIVKDIALYCVELVEGKNGITIPFSSRDGWQTQEIRQRAFDAAFVTTAIASAKKEQIDSSSGEAEGTS